MDVSHTLDMAIYEKISSKMIAIVIVTDRTFGSAELFGRTSTVWFGPNDRTFFCRTQNFFFTIYCIYLNGYLRYFKFDKKVKLFCGDNFRQKYSTTFKIVLLVRSGVPT
jgi:hypothetical protein